MFQRIKRSLERRIVLQTDRALLYAKKRAMNSESFTKLFYGVFSSRYLREQKAFLNGANRHNKALEKPGAGHAFLRRNIHRIEKGLLMRPRRNLFAVDYIESTVRCFKAVLQEATESVAMDKRETRWAGDVLKEYFSVVDESPEISSAREIYASIEFQADPEQSCIPYYRLDERRPGFTIEEFEALATYRRSVRWFQQKPVEREKIDRAIKVARQAPSACNRQPFVFRIFDDRNLVKEVAKLPWGTSGYDHNIPVMIVLVGQQRNYQDERDRHLIYIDASLAAMSFIFAAELQGLSTCCLNWPDIEERELKMAEVLHLESDERPVMCMAVGYPDPEGMVAYSAKKSLDQLRRYNLE